MCVRALRQTALPRRWRLLFEAAGRMARRSKFRRQGRLWERPSVLC